MRKYYTRPCNFYYGNYARNLVRKKKAFLLAGNPNIAFDQLEIFQRKAKGVVKSELYPISEIKTLDRKKASIIKTDLKKIISKSNLQWELLIFVFFNYLLNIISVSEKFSNFVIFHRYNPLFSGKK